MHIFFSAGEPSGDDHGRALIEELRRRDPDVRVSGFGGPEMEAAGQEQLYRLTDMAVMGIMAVLPLLRKFFQRKAEAREFIERERPDAVVLIDFPGFHWHIAKVAKQAGVPVFYYMPPQLWAWAPWRIRKVRKFVDTVLSGLPFETEWYRRHEIDVVRVPHPFFEDVQKHELNAGERDAIAAKGRIVAVLPGSRSGEIRKNLPVQLMAVRQLAERHPDVHFPIACYRDKQRRLCEQIVQQDIAENGPLPVELYTALTPEILDAAEMTLMVSGSVSLEVLAREVPAVVLYRGSVMMWAMGHLLITVDHFTLPNLIAGREVMPEFPFWTHLEKHARNMAYILDRWLSRDDERTAVVDQLRAIRRDMHSSGGPAVAIDAILKRLPAATVEAGASNEAGKRAA